MSKESDALVQRITEYMTDLHAHKNKVTELEAAVSDLRKEISRQKSQLKKVREEKAKYRKEVEALKNRLKTSD